MLEENVEVRRTLTLSNGVVVPIQSRKGYWDYSEGARHCTEVTLPDGEVIKTYGAGSGSLDRMDELLRKRFARTRSPKTSKMLNLSLYHITRETSRWLTDQVTRDGAWSIIAYAKSDYGFFLPILDDEELIDTGFTIEEIPLDLKRVIELARQQGCGWLMLDQDTPLIDGLPWHIW